MLVTCPECATRYEVQDSAFSLGGRAVRCNHCGCEWYQIGPSGSVVTPEMAAASAEEEPALLGGSTEADDVMTPPQGGFDDLPSPTALPSAAPSLPADPPMGAPRSRRLETQQRSMQAQPAPAPYVGGGVATAAHDPDIHLPAVYDEDLASTSPAPRSQQKRSGFGAVLGGVALGAAAIGGLLFFGPNLMDQMNGLSPAEGGDVRLASSDSGATVQPGVVLTKSEWNLVERPEGPALEIWGDVANNGPGNVVSPRIEIITRDENGAELQKWHVQPEIDVLTVGQKARFTSRMMFPAGPVHDVDFYLADQ